MYVKMYGKLKGLDVKCFVFIYLFVNYILWQIVSFEVSLVLLDCVDGYIVQVWMGIVCELNYYDGVKKEWVFENVFFEYGCMKLMIVLLNCKMYFLIDFIEDWVKDWFDYKINYQVIFVV